MRLSFEIVLGSSTPDTQLTKLLPNTGIKRGVSKDGNSESKRLRKEHASHENKFVFENVKQSESSSFPMKHQLHRPLLIIIIIIIMHGLRI